jgi:hypothetical protein
MKKLLLTTLLAVSMTLGAYAQTVTISTLTATNGVAITTPHRLLSIEATSAAGSLVRLYDHNNKDLLNITAEYITQTSYPTTLVSQVITSTGLTNTYTNTVIWHAAITNAAATNVASPFMTFTATATPLRLTLDRFNARGLVVSNVGTATLVLGHSTP